MSGSITRELTRFFLYSRKGNKILLIITITIILICFMKLGEVAAVEEVEDVNYKAYTYYDGVVNEAILRLSDNWDNLSQTIKDGILTDNRWFYFYYGSADGSSYNNAKPTNNGTLYIMYIGKGNISNATATANDYLGITGITMYQRNYTGAYQISSSNNVTDLGNATRYLPYEFVQTYTNSNWVTFINSIKNGDTATLVALLEDIKAEQQEMNDYLQSDDTSEVDTELPTESVEDPTEALWSDLFTSIRTAATSNTPQYISITIPFINYSFSFSPIESSPMTQLRAKMEPLYNLIIASWWFGASLWIIRDIHKYLEDIKNGDITSRDNNIKTEVL